MGIANDFAVHQGIVKVSLKSQLLRLSEGIEVGGAALRALRSASLEAIRERHDTVPTL